MFGLFKKKENPFATSLPSAPVSGSSGSFKMTVEDVFSIAGRGTVATGKIESGGVAVGDMLKIRRMSDETITAKVAGIEAFKKTLDIAHAGMDVGILVEGFAQDHIISSIFNNGASGRDQIQKGDVLEK